MASVEYLTKRVEGKKKEIAKLESKLSRIEKAKATNWEVNPYYYHEDDLRWTLKDLETARRLPRTTPTELSPMRRRSFSAPERTANNPRFRIWIL